MKHTRFFNGYNSNTETPRFADEITDSDGKKYYTGQESIMSLYAKELGYVVRVVGISGHCISVTIHDFAHWRGGPLHNGPVRINGELPDLTIVATVEGRRSFFERIQKERKQKI